MRFLLDTHLLLWLVQDDTRLPKAIIPIVEDAANQPHFSTASIWEVATKFNLGRPDFRVEPRVVRDALLQSGYTELPILGQHALGIVGLPPTHKDPFDRILIAQAIVEDMPLLTTDSLVAQYPGPIRLV